MIIEIIFNSIASIINLIPFSLPELPSKFNDVLDLITNGIISSLGYIAFFIDLKFWISCAIAMTVVYNIRRLWNTIVFILNFIPTVHISYW